ncbi:MAG: D-alanyl-D-alanine carboxypeptidase [Sphingobacteriales bacterium]|nr:D-alanyl-D-alanine carboxypeptidase [Sphingobacteriales bacterium]
MKTCSHKRSLLFWKQLFIINCSLSIALASCSVSKQISKSADHILINDTSISTGHIGISVYEPAANKYWYNYNAEKYFVPASNTKLFTLYAGMKYLGDSLEGLRLIAYGTDTLAYPTADPTFLHKDFPNQPVFDFLKRSVHVRYTYHFFIKNDLGLGKGWAWDDYTEAYMPHRSRFPIYGNLFAIMLDDNKKIVTTIPSSVKLTVACNPNEGFSLTKNWDDNVINLKKGKGKAGEIPFVPIGADVATMINDTLGKIIYIKGLDGEYDIIPTAIPPIYSRPTDELLKPMMHNSDNFFAEQTLLMASNQKLGYMSDETIIDSLLKTDLKDVPQQPKWVDGSGLSRYNLFTPQSFIYILNKMKNEFGFDRLKTILPTGGEGTLKNYYLQDSTFIYAKTGSLSNNTSLSGFLITKKNKVLIFSILVNNFQGSATPVKRAIEKFLQEIRDRD